MMGKSSIRNLRQQEALASLLLDSENANQLYSQRNPEQIWHTQDFIIAKPSSHKITQRDMLKTKFISLKLHPTFNVKERKNEKLNMSPRSKTRPKNPSMSTSNKINMRNLSLNENESNYYESFCTHELPLNTRVKSKKFQFVKQKLHAISMVLSKPQPSEAGVTKMQAPRQPISYSRYLKQRVHQAKLSQRLTSNQPKFE